MTLTESLQTLPTLFMLVTLPIYILYLITLHKNRHDAALKFPFFTLMFNLGIADVGMIIVLLLGNTLAGYGWVPEVYILLGGLSARLYNAGLYGFGLVQNLGVFVVAINRYTAYMQPLKHNKIWTDKFARNIIIMQWTISLIAIIPVLFYFEFQITLLANNRTVLLQWTDGNENTMHNIIISLMISGGIAIIIVIVYAIIFSSAFIRKISSQQPMSKVEKTALKMAVTGFISSIGLLIYLIDTYILFGSWYLFAINYPDVATFYMIFDVGHSIYAAVNPYAMFLFSSTVRHRFGALLCSCWCAGSEQTISNSRRTMTVQPAVARPLRAL